MEPFTRKGMTTESNILECVCVCVWVAVGVGDAYNLQSRPTVIYLSASCPTHMWTRCLILNNDRCSSVLPPCFPSCDGLNLLYCKLKPILPFITSSLSGTWSLQQEKQLIYYSIMLWSEYSKLWCILYIELVCFGIFTLCVSLGHLQHIPIVFISFSGKYI